MPLAGGRLQGGRNGLRHLKLTQGSAMNPHQLKIRCNHPVYPMNDVCPTPAAIQLPTLKQCPCLWIPQRKQLDEPTINHQTQIVKGNDHSKYSVSLTAFFV